MKDLDWVLTQTEGQFFERKGCYDRSGSKPKLRPARAVAKDIAETLAAMANADGGTLAVGIEDDGEVTGAGYPADKIRTLKKAPQTHINPPLKPKVTEGSLNGKPVLVFEIDWSGNVHQLTDGRYALRVGDRNMPFPASGIEALKEGKTRQAAEMRFMPGARIADLDLGLVARFAEKTGLKMSPEETLLRYRLVEGRNGNKAVTMAALLLFGRDPGKWHPRCGIDFVKYEGTDQRVGARLNIVKRERLEAPLVLLIEEAYETIKPHLRERQRLVDLFFEERLEYPAFAWQEAVVNAVAHRDYGLEGLGIEIWMFDDRLEVRSPGMLMEPVTLDRLEKRERIHASRNPRIVRILTDYGYMRELGEGIPRIFEAMEREGLYPPEFRLEADAIFSLTLKNTVAFQPATLKWLAQFGDSGLNGDQKRILAYAKEHGMMFTSRDYQKLVGVDIYAASRDIKALIRKGIVRPVKKGGRLYEALDSAATGEREKPEEFAALETALEKKGFVKNEDIRLALGVSRRHAIRIAQQLVDTGWLRAEGERRGRRYVLPVSGKPSN